MLPLLHKRTPETLLLLRDGHSAVCVADDILLTKFYFIVLLFLPLVLFSFPFHQLFHLSSLSLPDLCVG